MRASRSPVVVFDLDDTLYPEADFVRSGFAAAGAAFEAETGEAGLAAACEALFHAGERSRVFDRALAARAPALAADWTQRLVEVYRGHAPQIALAPDAARWLGAQPLTRAIGLVTDGESKTQRAKIAALGLGRLVREIVCTGDWGRAYWKPHPRAFEEIERRFGFDPGGYVYVADNPLKDFVTPRRRGWLTIQVARPERVRRVHPPDADHAADAVIASLDELDATLDATLEANAGQRERAS